MGHAIATLGGSLVTLSANAGEAAHHAHRRAIGSAPDQLATVVPNLLNSGTRQHRLYQKAAIPAVGCSPLTADFEVRFRTLCYVRQIAEQTMASTGD